MRTDLFGRIADARAAAIMGGMRPGGLVLLIGERTLTALKAEAAPYPLWPEDEHSDPNVLEMPVYNLAIGEGFIVTSMD